MKPENSQRILNNLKSVGVRMIVSLPDSWLVDVQVLAKNDPELRNVLVAWRRLLLGVSGNALPKLRLAP